MVSLIRMNDDKESIRKKIYHAVADSALKKYVEADPENCISQFIFQEENDILENIFKLVIDQFDANITVDSLMKGADLQLISDLDKASTILEIDDAAEPNDVKYALIVFEQKAKHGYVNKQDQFSYFTLERCSASNENEDIGIIYEHCSDNMRMVSKITNLCYDSFIEGVRNHMEYPKSSQNSNAH